MKKKYYLRGLGIGILVTALLFVIALVFHKPHLSDAEIRRQARALGMIDAAEADDYSDDQDSEEENTDQQESDDQITEETTENDDGSTTTTTTEELTGDDVEKAPDERVKTPVDSDTSESESASADSDNSSSKKTDSSESSDNSSGRDSDNSSAATGEKVTITVRSGQNSGQVASALASAGLVDDGRSFDRYLESNGYDRIIRPGDYEIPEGASYEQIAQILIRR